MKKNILFVLIAMSILLFFARPFISDHYYDCEEEIDMQSESEIINIEFC